MCKKQIPITLDMLVSRYDRPLCDVAEEYGCSMTYMKKACRKHGIKRWPYRKVLDTNLLHSSTILQPLFLQVQAELVRVHRVQQQINRELNPVPPPLPVPHLLVANVSAEPFAGPDQVNPFLASLEHQSVNPAKGELGTAQGLPLNPFFAEWDENDVNDGSSSCCCGGGGGGSGSRKRNRTGGLWEELGPIFVAADEDADEDEEAWSREIQCKEAEELAAEALLSYAGYTTLTDVEEDEDSDSELEEVLVVDLSLIRCQNARAVLLGAFREGPTPLA